jgi:hypothetical protein
MSSSTGSTKDPRSDGLTLGQAAIRLGCTYRHARRLVAKGLLLAENKGDANAPSWRVTPDELELFATERASRKVKS